jgi:murein DD-endopeptidase MepM/ murein hydrolase activator NlpD
MAGCADTLGDVEAAVQAALSQVGKPYRWSNPPAGKRFDAAELTQWAYSQAGTVLPGTANEQLKAGPAVKKPGTGAWSSVVQRGDLLYWSDGFNGVGRVTMFVGSGQMVNVTSASAVVTVENVNWDAPLQGLIGVTRPIDNNSGGGQHSGWQWPLKSTTVTSPFGMRYHPIKHIWVLHEGVDFAAQMGTPVYAAKAGTVTMIYTSFGGGNTVRIDHGGGVETEYLHLSGFDTKVGAKVSGGQRIAFSGNSGRYTTGAHLHFNVIVSHTNVDPITYLKKFGLVP